nr:probable tRNA (guanine(26)-N(2))-dimethyltransferase 1 [Tanacetum cinerariifolium]
MSIVVLRTFISKRKQEHEALLAKRMKKASKVSKDPVSNGKSKETQQDEPRGTREKVSEGGDRGELKPSRVLEALSGTGLIAIRYARKVKGVGQVVALDNDKASVEACMRNEACRRNIKFNGSVASAKVESNLVDARVDLDLYGSPSVFMDSAIQSVADGGMLTCTAIDMAVLCGGDGEVCYSKFMSAASCSAGHKTCCGFKPFELSKMVTQLDQNISVYFMLLMQDLMLPVVILYVNVAIDTTAIGFKRKTAPTNDPVNIPKPPQNVVSSSSALANSPAFVRPSRTPTSAKG